MKLLEFYKHFPDKSSCKQHFKTHRQKEVIFCLKCKGTNHNWVKIKVMFECKFCRYQMSLKKGTLMENSKLKYKIYMLI